MSKQLNLVGSKFSRLTVVRQEHSKNGRSRWLCLCSCGNKVVVYGKSLVSGNTKSCGCQKHDSIVMFNKRTKRTHNETFTRLYKIWHSMKCRCSQSIFPNYYGRGISVCTEWNESFEAFRNWAQANGYNDGLSIDRIDNDGNYEPTNCRWVTTKAQGRNRRNNRSIFGKTLSEWAEITGLSRSTISYRIDHLGWTEEKAISTPLRGSNG